MYSGMSSLTAACPTVERGIALHKVCYLPNHGDSFPCHGFFVAQFTESMP